MKNNCKRIHSENISVLIYRSEVAQEKEA